MFWCFCFTNYAYLSICGSQAAPPRCKCCDSLSQCPHTRQTDSSGHRWYENTDASLLPLYAAVTTHSARKYGHNGLSFDCYWVWFRANVTKDMFLRLHQVKLNKKSSKCKRTFDGCTKSCWRIYLLMQPGERERHEHTHMYTYLGCGWIILTSNGWLKVSRYWVCCVHVTIMWIWHIEWARPSWLLVHLAAFYLASLPVCPQHCPTEQPR